MASLGPNVRMMERVPTDMSESEPELILPSDGILEADKLHAKEAVAARIRAFDAAQPKEYSVGPPDRTLETIFTVLDHAFQAITTVHYRKYQTFDGDEQLIEETWYQSPGMLKTHQRGRWIMIKNVQLIYLGPDQRLFSQQPVGGEAGWLMEIRKPHGTFLRDGYNWTVEQLLTPPALLGSLYQEHAPDLYLFTGQSQSDDGVGWPPVIKSEYIVDVRHGLLVGLREYWRRVLGSGREEELAVTDVVTQWQTYGDGIFVPTAGRREQLVDEGTVQGPTHRVVHSTWRIAIEQLNAAFPSAVFDLSEYTESE